tara:strand:- start:881 stop:1162 length:282 start_codon:yes stop_codon:yes gene_type:complete
LSPQNIEAEYVGSGEEATVIEGNDEIVTVDPSANAVPELDPPDELSIALLQTERTTANVHTSNIDQRRFFQDSDMIDPLIEVYKKPILTKSGI